MKLIKQSKLFFKEGNSDKVYEIDLCELSAGAYLVNFRYGKRGANLKEGTKTPAAVTKDEAEKIFSSLEGEKRKKGYQTENEVFVELPSLQEVKPDSKQGVIMHRLQDAVENKSSFKTQWKTSRVIWSAATLGMREAIPYIIKLTSKGDELQTYSSLYALLKLKATEAEELFRSFAFMGKQKKYINNIANEALLTILEGEKRENHIQLLVEKVPSDIRNAIDNGDLESLKKCLDDYTAQNKVDFISDLYLAYKFKPDVITVTVNVMKNWELRPPFFKQIRAVYKLGQIRGDMFAVATLAYKFEKSNAMFTRTQPLDDEDYGWQFIVSLNESFNVGKELRKKDSKLGFSGFTKKYLQKNSVNYIKSVGESGNSKDYIRLAIATLLQYNDSDYSPAGEKLLSNYGNYNWDTREYHYTMVNYCECTKALMLSTILFGNDTDRILDLNMSFIYGKRYLKSRHYYYKPEQVTEIKRIGICGEAPAKREITPPKNGAGASSIFSSIKNIFGKKDEENPHNLEDTPTQNHAEKEKPSRLELYPEYWDAMPQSYIMLLMKSPMKLVQKFAYENLLNHPEVDEILSRLDTKDLLMLFNTGYEYPSKLALDILNKRSDELTANKPFVASLLSSKCKGAREWAQKAIEKSPDFYTDDIEFIFTLIFNPYEDCRQWVYKLLEKTNFTADRVKALLGKSVMEMLQMDNTEENNKLAEKVIKRLLLIGDVYFAEISWDIAGKLMSSPLDSNTILAGKIIIKKAEKADPKDIPLDLASMFITSEIQGVRNNGIVLFNKYPHDFLKQNEKFLFGLANTPFIDVLGVVLSRIESMISYDRNFGEKAIYHLIYLLIRKEKFEGAHKIIKEFINNELKNYWDCLNTKDIITLIYANYRDSQLTGYEILKNYSKPNDFSVGQIVALGNHEILAVRQWCWNYFNQNAARIRYERDKAFAILDSKWDDTRAFAFNFFKTQFTETDWDVDTLIAITDSVRKDVEKFGKDLIIQYFKPDTALEFLTKLSEHPSTAIQMFVSSYLSHYAAGNVEIIKGLDYYFRSTLTRVNKGRVAKNRVFEFLKEESLKNEESARFIGEIMDDLSAQTTVQDKETCIDILTGIKTRYPELKMHLTIIN